MMAMRMVVLACVLAVALAGKKRKHADDADDKLEDNDGKRRIHEHSIRYDMIRANPMGMANVVQSVLDMVGANANDGRRHKATLVVPRPTRSSSAMSSNDGGDTSAATSAPKKRKLSCSNEHEEGDTAADASNDNIDGGGASSSSNDYHGTDVELQHTTAPAQTRPCCCEAICEVIAEEQQRLWNKFDELKEQLDRLDRRG